MKRAHFKYGVILVIGGLIFAAHTFMGSDAPMDFSSPEKSITVIDHGAPLFLGSAKERTVGDILEKYDLNLREGDTVFPSVETLLSSGQTILVTRAAKLMVRADGREETVHTRERTVALALTQAGIALDEDDIVKPGREARVYSGLTVQVTRVTLREERKEIPIAFETKITEDSELSFRKTIVRQKGENGVKRTTYRVAVHDGKEVSRKIVSTEIVREPTPELVTQGTYVKLGKSHTGAASWYAWTGTMAAANPWLPKGSYVKVTNVDNGKSVIVKINDRGPFVPGRIIDLDKVAFAKIASIGAGVINVKMEEIAN